VRIQVAVPVPHLDLLTYSVSDDQPVPAVGARVVVPLGSRIVTGIVIEHVHAADAGLEVKPVRQVLDAGPCVPEDLVALARWTAEYYAAGVGDTIPALLPPMARGGRTDAHKRVRVAAITAAGTEALAAASVGAAAGAGDNRGGAAPAPLRMTARQRDALELLAGSPSGISTPVLAGRGIAADTIARLARHGYVSLRHDRLERDPFAMPHQSAVAQAFRCAGSGGPEGPHYMKSEPDGAVVQAFRPAGSGGSEGPHYLETGLPDRKLTAVQAEAFERLQAIAATGQFRVVLLHGVTGSGKTEIYLRLAADVCRHGRSALMLVPEIALTPAVTETFRQQFGERVAIQHSGLSAGERHDQWQRIRRGDVDVVIGTRSAVFAPLAHIGLIVVDEEHDASYKQDESPRYNGRDVAIVRGQHAGALVVLGSATPSMESYHRAVTGKYDRVVLERRILDRPLAVVTVVDMREEFAAAGPDVILSRALGDAIRTRLDRGEQALVLLNRRGFATAVFCRQCAGTIDCPNCSVSLVVHGEGSARRARCHYCNFTARVPKACPLCGGEYLEQTGFGTERVEAEVRAVCAGARVGRLDRDAIRRRGALAALLSQFRSGGIDVLVGTQMIAKGHDFPRVTLVGVVSADVGLGIADFRASERTFQLLTQVAGRAGRGDQPGEAIVQTLYPEHYSIRLACRQDYAAFYERELHFRRAMRYPPVLSLINTVVRSRTFAGAMDDAADIVQKLREADGGRDQFRVLGPAPAPLGRLRGEYRAQLLVKGANRKLIRAALRAALTTRPDLQRRIVVDVDPLNVL
jgi:primosomal protein N' (replication factor Y) (superfamily II helicase)